MVSAIAALVGAILAWALIHDNRPDAPAPVRVEGAGAAQPAPA